jgi:hypothetical protein
MASCCLVLREAREAKKGRKKRVKVWMEERDDAQRL